MISEPSEQIQGRQQSARRGRKKHMWVRYCVGVALFFSLFMILTLWALGPEPPSEITIATGDETGFYHEIGKQYKQHMEEKGIVVHLVTTTGSLDNYRRVINGQVDVALVQAGTYADVKHRDSGETIRGLAAIQLEPIWVFYKGRVSKTIAELQKHRSKRKKDMGQLRVSIGERGSGTEAVAKTLLQANGVTKTEAEIVHLSMPQTKTQLFNGQIDVGFLVSSARNSIVKELFDRVAVDEEENPSDETLHVLNFKRHLAYSRQFSYLSIATIGEGVLDLEHNIPRKDLKVLAIPTLLVSRKDLHPRVVEQFLLVAEQVHKGKELIVSDDKFPSLEHLDVPAHTAAAAYMKSGQSFWTRWLPYWGLWIVFRIQLFVIPLLLVWLPMFRIFPFFYKFRLNWLLRQHYKVLLAIQEEVENAETPEEIEFQLEELVNLRKEMESVSRKIPMHLQTNIFQWRLHVSMVRNEARKLLRQMRSTTNEKSEPTETSAGSETEHSEGTSDI